MKKREEIKLKVNGIEYLIEIEPWRTLIEVLRDTLGLTGTKNPVMKVNVVPVQY